MCICVHASVAHICVLLCVRRSCTLMYVEMSRISESDKSLWNDDFPKIVVCGLRKSGKSSILRVLFNKLSPHEASYIDSTLVPTFLPLSVNPMLKVRVAEIPGCWSWDESAELDEIFFSRCQSLVLVIDSADEQVHASVFSLCKRVIARAIRVNSRIPIHLLLHKIDANYKFDPDSVQCENNKAVFVQSIVSRINQDVGLLTNNARIDLSAHCTSIFDSSINEAFSKIVQRPLLANGKIEQIIDTIVTSCRLEKAFLFDIVSKINFADSGAGSSLLNDMLEVVVDMCSIYAPAPACDTKTECSISLSNGEILFMRLIEKHLAFVAIVKAENFDKTFLMNHNINAFKDALMLIVE